MKLEKNLESNHYPEEKTGCLAEIINLSTATFTTTLGYIIAGDITKHTNYSNFTETVIAGVVISLAALGGYKIIPTINRLKRLENEKEYYAKDYRKFKRNIARNKTLREIAKDDDFLERQKIKREKLGKTKSAIRTLLLSPIGGTLGYIPGYVATTPLCYYFGEKSFNLTNSSKIIDEPALGSGLIAGTMVGTYSFAEMSLKKQYERLITTASTLAGITAGALTEGPVSHQLKMNNSVWPFVGYCLATGLAAGAISNILYKSIKKIFKKSS